MKSTYPNHSAALTQVFNEIPPAKILIVPLDFAKEKHVVRLCDGRGQYLHKNSFVVLNDPSGIEYLLKRIQSACMRNDIKQAHVFIACENPHSYCIHFMQELQSKGYKVVTVNAGKAKSLRKNSLASSDTIDLDGIANSIFNRQAGDLIELDELYYGIKLNTRNYKRYTKDGARQKNRIGRLVDELFPGFLNKKKSGIDPYSRICLELMSRGFSVYKIRRMKVSSLSAKMRKLHINDAVNKATQLIEYASKVIAPSKIIVDTLSRSLEEAVKLYKALGEAANAELEQSAQLLVQTPYVTLLSIPGIGLVRAGAFAAEFGNPKHWRSRDQMCSYAGIAPRIWQSGGPDKAAIVIGLPHACNRRLKDALLQSAHQTGMTAHVAGKHLPQCKEHRLMRHYKQVNARAGKSGLSTARMIISLMRNMVLGGSLYLPHELILEPEELAIYLTMSFEKMDNTLKGLSLSLVKPENNYLMQMKQQWKSILEELCDSDINFNI